MTTTVDLNNHKNIAHRNHKKIKIVTQTWRMLVANSSRTMRLLLIATKNLVDVLWDLLDDLRTAFMHNNCLNDREYYQNLSRIPLERANRDGRQLYRPIRDVRALTCTPDWCRSEPFAWFSMILLAFCWSRAPTPHLFSGTESPEK